MKARPGASFSFSVPASAHVLTGTSFAAYAFLLSQLRVGCIEIWSVSNEVNREAV
jgi:hypothetical protein